MLQRFSTRLISGEFGGQHVFSGWPWLRVLVPRLGRTSCGDWNWTIFACLLLHSHFYGEGQASLLSLICCWCSNRQSKSVLGVKKSIPVRLRPVIPPHMIHFELFLTWYAGGTWLSWEPQTISFFGLGSWNKYLGHSSEKRKSSHSSAARFFALLSKFQSSCTLLGCEQRFLLLSQRSPTFAFHKPPDGYWEIRHQSA